MQFVGQNQPFAPYLSCFAAGLFSFYNLLQFSLFNSISTHLLAEFHMVSTQLGAVSGVYLFANALGLIPGGPLLDNYSARRIGLIFIILAILGNFIIAQTHSLTLLFIMRFIQGLASAISLLLSTRLVTIWFPNHTGVALGGIITLALLGGMVGNSVFSYLAISFGWRQILVWSGIVGLIIFVIMFFFLNEKKSIRTIIYYKNLTSVINAEVILIGLYIGLMNLPIFIFASLWGNLFLQQVYKVSYSHAAEISSLLFFGIMIGGPISGWLSDKFKNYKLLFMIGALGALSLLLLIVCKKSFTLNALKFLFLGWGIFSSVQIIGYAYLSDRYNLSKRSSATGIASFIENGIGALAQLTFGFMLNLTWSGIFYEGIPLYTRDNYLIALILFFVTYIICISICFSKKIDNIK